MLKRLGNGAKDALFCSKYTANKVGELKVQGSTPLAKAYQAHGAREKKQPSKIEA